jgi:Predicted membrane protein
MAAVIRSLMSREPVTWMLYGIGAAIAVVAELSQIPPLAFALGMYLPLHLTTPLLVGGFLSHLVKTSTKDKELSEKRHNRGTLISSGFIAGGALMGIVLAVLKLTNLDHYVSLGIPLVLQNGKWVDGAPTSWFNQYGEIISLIVFIVLMGFVYWESKKEK